MCRSDGWKTSKCRLRKSWRRCLSAIAILLCACIMPAVFGRTTYRSKPKWSWKRTAHGHPYICLFQNVYVYMHTYEKEYANLYIFIFIYIYIYVCDIYIYIYVCVCVSVYRYFLSLSLSLCFSRVLQVSLSLSLRLSARLYTILQNAQKETSR